MRQTGWWVFLIAVFCICFQGCVEMTGDLKPGGDTDVNILWDQEKCSTTINHAWFEEDSECRECVRKVIGLLSTFDHWQCLFISPTARNIYVDMKDRTGNPKWKPTMEIKAEVAASKHFCGPCAKLEDDTVADHVQDFASFDKRIDQSEMKIKNAKKFAVTGDNEQLNAQYDLDQYKARTAHIKNKKKMNDKKGSLVEMTMTAQHKEPASPRIDAMNSFVTSVHANGSLSGTEQRPTKDGAEVRKAVAAPNNTMQELSKLGASGKPDPPESSLEDTTADLSLTAPVTRGFHSQK